MRTGQIETSACQPLPERGGPLRELLRAGDGEDGPGVFLGFVAVFKVP